jgi:serine phosphatase RsbU (regulator of sigma subunit)
MMFFPISITVCSKGNADMLNSLAISPTLILTILLAVFFLLALYAVVYLTGSALLKNRQHGARNRRPRLASLWQDEWQGRRQGLGLRYKLALFTIVLVLLVIFVVSIPLYYMMIREQQKTVLKGLWDRSVVLLEGMHSSTRFLFQADTLTELRLLPPWIAAVPEARYLTITGCDTPSAYEDRVWASNDPDIFSKINTPYLQPGISLLTDAISPLLDTMPWRELSGRIIAEPKYTLNYVSENDRFIFCMPVDLMSYSGDRFFRGLLRLEVSVDSIIQEMRENQTLLERTILIIAIAVLVLGIIGALILSSLIIRPIQTLVRHVAIFRDTKDKQDLVGLEVQINSRDEIAVLGDTINEMTNGLAVAAAAASDLSIGREIQKKFLPLELDKNGNKLNSGCKETDKVVFFGYYAEAAGISGDYFDYHDIDGRYYAIIKCDVAGSGIPAALIMIQVATMFLNYFKEWEPDAEGMHIERAVYQINGFIETLGFEGRFAAFTLCIFDSQTGELHFCNAGDNIIHIFDSSEMCIKNITLPQTPAAGVLPNNVVESKGGYRVQTLTLGKGDILLLYTDGIEESKRKFRDSDLNDHDGGGEEFGAERVQDVINTVMNRGTYRLDKWYDSAEDLCFDFSGCDGKVEDMIMALISVEKIFRCYYTPHVVRGEWVLIDKKIDTFLKNHFLQYHKYCAETHECTGNNAYMYYTHLREDEQYDDLTILGVKRK